MTALVVQFIRRAGINDLERFLLVRRTEALWILLGMALLARAAVAVLFTNFDPATASLWEFGTIAHLTVEHGKMLFVVHLNPGASNAQDYLYPTAFMPPGYVWVWIIAFKLFGFTRLALEVVTALNVVLGTGIVYYAARIARALFASEIVAVGVGAILALHPVFAYSVATYHALNLYIILLLIVFDLTLSTRRQTIWVAIFAGLATGAAILVRNEYLVLAGAIHLGALINHRNWKATAIAAVTTLVLLAPWTIRNYAVFHRFIPITNSTGYNLYKGFNPESNGSGHWVGMHYVAERRLGDQLARVPLNSDYENGIEKVYKDNALEYIRNNPVRCFVELPLIKLGLYWFYDYTDTTTHQLAYQIQFWPLFILTIIGLVLAARAGYFANPDHRTVLLLFAFQCVVTVGYAVHARYRMNTEPFLYAYAIFGAVGAVAWVRDRVGRRAGGSEI